MNKSYRLLLQNELQNRTAKNSYYSLRAFARDLDVSPSRLSEALNGVKGISAPLAEKICKKLNLDKKWTDFFITSVIAEHGRNPKLKKQAKDNLEEHIAICFDENRPLETPKTETMVAWYFLPVLRLFENKIKNFKQIADTLEITEDQAEHAFRFLKRLGYIEEVKDKAYLAKRGQDRVLNLNFGQISEISKDRFQRENVKDYFANEVIFLDEDQIKEAKRIISRCHRDLLKLHQDRKLKNVSIYSVNSQLFEINKINPGKGK